VLGAVPNAGLLEYVPWTDAIFNEPITVVGEDILLPEGPGLGVTLRDDIKKYSA
jgi:L-alanine-DL-glutamate epimerase-like enolase superfamily enzyme